MGLQDMAGATGETMFGTTEPTNQELWDALVEAEGVLGQVARGDLPLSEEANRVFRGTLYSGLNALNEALTHGVVALQDEHPAGAGKVHRALVLVVYLQEEISDWKVDRDSPTG